MKLTTLIFFLLISISGVGKDKNNASIFSRDTIVGADILHDAPLKCKQYKLPYGVSDYHYDKAGGKIVVLSKLGNKGSSMNRGDLALYDIAADSFQWQVRVNMSEMRCGGDYIILENTGASACYDKNTGEQLWRKEYIHIKYIDTLNAIGLTSLGKGVDLKTGDVIWSEKLRTDDFWTDFVRLNDTMLAVLSNGLHVINLRKGETFTYTDRASKKGNGVMFAYLGAGILTGVLTGYYFIPISGPGVIWGLNSQVLVDKDKLYLAIMNKIICVNYATGSFVWEGALPDHAPGSTFLVSRGEKVVAISEGTVRDQFGKKQLHSQPFFAAYDKFDGTQSFIVDLAPYGFIADKTLSNDVLTLVFPFSIRKYNIDNGREVFVQKGPRSKNMQYSDILDPRLMYIIYSGATFTSVASLGEDVHAISTFGDNFTVLTSSYEEMSTYSFSSVAPLYAGNRFVKIIFDGKESCVLKNDQVVARIHAKSRGLLLDNKYYVFDGNVMNVIDLSVFN